MFSFNDFLLFHTQLGRGEKECIFSTKRDETIAGLANPPTGEFRFVPRERKKDATIVAQQDFF